MGNAESRGCTFFQKVIMFAVAISLILTLNPVVFGYAQENENEVQNPISNTEEGPESTENALPSNDTDSSALEQENTESEVFIPLLSSPDSLQITEADSLINITGQSISDLETAINGALVTFDSIELSGSNTAVDTTLTINIPTGKTVIWNATYIAAPTMLNNMIVLPGDGTFEVGANGVISTTYNDPAGYGYPDCIAINASGANASVVVAGGTVTATANSSTAILASGTNSSVTMSAGEISNTYAASSTVVMESAIRATGTSATITLTGGVARNANTGGKTAVISVPLGGNITDQRVSIKGTAQVISEGASSFLSRAQTLFVFCGVIIEDQASISSNAGETTIYGPLSMSGGSVTTTLGGMALNCFDAVTVTGGTISSEMSPAITTKSYLGSAPAISIENAIVNSTSGEIIHQLAESGSVHIGDGAILYAHGTTPLSSLIFDPYNTFTAPTGTGVIVAWDAAQSITDYDAGTSNNLTIWPSEGIATWMKGTGVDGVAFENGTASGFIPVVEVTVSLITPTAADFQFTTPTGLVYDGTSKGIGSVSGQGNFNDTTGGTITVYYEGVAPTIYARSTDLPTDAGSYKVTVDTTGGTIYAQTSNIELVAEMVIAKADQPAPSAFDLSYLYDQATGNYTVEIPYMLNVEYSFDGTNFGPTRTTTAAIGDTVTGYIRFVADKNHNVGGATSAQVTLPEPMIERTLTDPETGISVTALMAPNAKLSLSNSTHAVGTCPVCDAILDAHEKGKLIGFKNIDIEGAYTGPVLVSIPVDVMHNGKSADMIHCNSMVLEKTPVTITDGRATASFDTLSPFGVVDTSSSGGTDQGKSNPPAGSAQTGDNSTVSMLVNIVAFSLALLIAAVILRKARRFTA